MLFHASGAIKRATEFREPYLEYALMTASCFGSENSIFACNYTRFRSGSRCSSEAGLICQSIYLYWKCCVAFSPKIILASNQTRSNCTDLDVRLEPSNGGKVLVCFNGVWGAVCRQSFSTQTASVICRNSGYRVSGIISNYFDLIYFSCNLVNIRISDFIWNYIQWGSDGWGDEMF